MTKRKIIEKRSTEPAPARPAASAADIDGPAIGPLHSMTLNWVPQNEGGHGGAPAETKIPAAIAPRKRIPRYAQLAATIALTASVGVITGVAATNGPFRDLWLPVENVMTRVMATVDSEVRITKLQAPEIQASAPEAPSTHALQDTVTQLVAEVAALKALQHNANEHVGSLARRLDRNEQAQAETAARLTRTAAVPPPIVPADFDATGSIGSAKQDAKSSMTDGWRLRDYYGGRALVQDRNGTLYEAAPGTNLPGLGRVDAIKRDNGRIVLVTRNGSISSVPDVRRALPQAPQKN
jgi:hypothetical protein